jgi:hypothetical protein
MDDSNDALLAASADLKMLLDRGYRKESSISFVGDHHHLNAKARNRLMREVFSDGEISDTESKLTPMEELEGADLAVDGFNVLITAETALLGGDAFVCQDGLMRDNSMVFSNFKIRDETLACADKVIDVLTKYAPRRVVWVFDSQISGSGKVAEHVRTRMEAQGLKGESITCPDADSHLLRLHMTTATSDTALIRKLEAIVDLPQAVLTAEEQ